MLCFFILQLYLFRGFQNKTEEKLCSRLLHVILSVTHGLDTVRTDSVWRGFIAIKRNPAFLKALCRG